MDQPPAPARLTGRCTDGFERGSGSLVHLLPGPYPAEQFGTALCGRRPGRLSGGWESLWEAEATCRRCRRAAGRRFKSARPDHATRGIIEDSERDSIPKPSQERPLPLWVRRTIARGFLRARYGRRVASALIVLSACGVPAEFTGNPGVLECRPLEHRDMLPTYRFDARAATTKAFVGLAHGGGWIEFVDLVTGREQQLNGDAPYLCKPEEEWAPTAPAGRASR